MHLAPFVVEKLWGGHKLAPMKGLKSGEPIGETWEVSCLKSGSSSFQGKPLSEIIPDLKYLIKFIDTSDYLSVQVHPHDEYAQEFENSQGKTECWFIMSAEPNAGIYLGFQAGVTKETFAKAIFEKEDLTPYLRFHPVKEGDFFYVPAGSIHAIGKGVTLIEVQQNSGITYRVWDWNRLENGKPRTLDVEKALDVLNFHEESNVASYFRFQEHVFSTADLDFLRHADFHISLVKIEKGETFSFHLAEEKNYSLINLAGKVKLHLGENQCDFSIYETIMMSPGTSGKLQLNAIENSFLLVVR